MDLNDTENNLTNRIIKTLADNKIKYQKHVHEPVFTSEDAAKIRGSKMEEGAKALIFFADGKPIQIVIQGDKRVDKEKFKSQFGFSKLKMVSAEDVKAISGVDPGAVPPYGNLFDPSIPVYATKSLLELNELEFNAGDHRISIRLKASDYRKTAKPIEGVYEQT